MGLVRSTSASERARVPSLGAHADPPALVVAPTFQRIVGGSADAAFALLTLIPLGLAASVALPGLASGGAFLATVNGWIDVGFFNQLKLGAAGALGAFVFLVGFGVTLSLRAIQWTQMERHGATLGKRAVGMKLVGPYGERIGFFRGIVLRRWVWLFLLSCPPTIALWFGYGGWARVLGWAAVIAEVVNDLFIFTPQRRTLNDLFAGTVVVTTSRAPITRSLAVLVAPPLAAVAVTALVLAIAYPSTWRALLNTWPAFSAPAARAASDRVVEPPPALPFDGPMTPAPADAGARSDAAAPTEPTLAPLPVHDAGVDVASSPSPPAPPAAPSEVAPAPERGALFSYVDDQGVPHIVQSLDAVPARFRASARSQ